MLLLAMDSNDTSHTYGDASDDASDDVSTGSDISFAEDLCIALLALLFRADSLVATRMNWHHHIQSLLHENFIPQYHISIQSFNHLLNLLSPKLCLKDKYAVLYGTEICSKIMLHCAIQFIAGCSYHDIHATANISKASFFT